MCEILIVPNIQENKSVETYNFMVEMAEQMSKRNNHGLGYAALAKQDNEVIVERWLDNSKAFIERPGLDVTQRTNEELNKAGQIINHLLENKSMFSFRSSSYQTGLSNDDEVEELVVEQEYGSEGSFILESPDDMKRIKSLTLHARMATSAKGFINTHPFVKRAEDKETGRKRAVSLIHNGVINNPDAYGKRITTNDSESLLKGYNIEKVFRNPDAIQKVSDKLEGYFACGVINSDSQDNANTFIDVFKESKATLYCAYVYDIGTYVFATSKFSLEDACKNLGYTILKCFEVADNVFMRINPDDGKFLLTKKFERSFRTSYDSWGTGNWNGGLAHGNVEHYPTKTNGWTVQKGRWSKKIGA